MGYSRDQRETYRAGFSGPAARVITCWCPNCETDYNDDLYWSTFFQLYVCWMCVMIGEEHSDRDKARTPHIQASPMPL